MRSSLWPHPSPLSFSQRPADARHRFHRCVVETWPGVFIAFAPAGETGDVHQIKTLVQFFNDHWPWLILMVTVVIVWWLAHRKFNVENNQLPKSTDSTATAAAADFSFDSLHSPCRSVTIARARRPLLISQSVGHLCLGSPAGFFFALVVNWQT
jgi:hypothetical protein